MSKEDDGGPAFPVSRYFRDGSVKEPEGKDKGMTLRDYFAAKALPGLIAAIMVNECHNWNPIDFAKESYLIADAMLQERKS